MLPKERVITALLGKEVDRIPVTAVCQTVTVEQMRAINIFWPSGHKNPEEMAKLAEAAYRVTGLETAKIPFDQTIEAEAMGCKIHLSERIEEIPHVKSTPYTSVEEIEIPDDLLERGRIPVLLEAVKILKKEVGDKLPVIGTVVAPFTLSTLLMGIIEYYKAMRMNPDKAKSFSQIATEICIILGNALVDAGVDIVTIEDMGASTDVISPKLFEEFAKGPLVEVFKKIPGIKVLHICGDVNPIISAVMETGTTGISIDQKTDIKTAKKILKGKTTIIGNIDPVKILWEGPIDKIKEESIKAIETGVDLLAPGCSIAPLTPNKHIEAMVEVAKTYKR